MHYFPLRFRRMLSRTGRTLTLAALALGMALAGCTVHHTPEIYRSKYQRDAFTVDAPVKTVAERTHRYATRCLAGESSQSSGGGAYMEWVTDSKLRWNGSGQATLSLPFGIKSSTHGMSTGGGSSFALIADFKAAGGKTQVTPYARSTLINKAIERWAKNISPSCPEASY